MPNPLCTGRRFRLPLDLEQANTLAQWLGCSRVAYHGKVDERLKSSSGELFKADLPFSQLKTDNKT